MPKSHSDFWEAKFERNQERDARKTRQLEAAGWQVVTVWECKLRQVARSMSSRRIVTLLNKDSGSPSDTPSRPIA